MTLAERGGLCSSEVGGSMRFLSPQRVVQKSAAGDAALNKPA